jgi:MerR family copper efflux transcriptional regulator
VEPIDFACTIDPAGLRQRVDQLDSLVRRVLERRRDGSTLAVEFPAQAAPDVRAFVVEESRCCPFFSFEVDEIDQRLRLTIRTPPGGEAMLDALHAMFAGDGTKLRARFKAAT